MHIRRQACDIGALLHCDTNMRTRLRRHIVDAIDDESDPSANCGELVDNFSLLLRQQFSMKFVQTNLVRLFCARTMVAGQHHYLPP